MAQLSAPTRTEALAFVQCCMLKWQTHPRITVRHPDGTVCTITVREVPNKPTFGFIRMRIAGQIIRETMPHDGRRHPGVVEDLFDEVWKDGSTVETA